jgi:hypothetical protein
LRRIQCALDRLLAIPRVSSSARGWKLAASGAKYRSNIIPQAWSFQVETAKESPAVRGAFSRENRLAYLLIPEPGPVGVSVDPLGEEPAPMVLPDGFVVVVEPGAAERDAPEPVVVLPEVPMPVPLTDEPVLAPPAAPPEAEPPAEPPPLCASAKVLDSARAVASAIVEIFMVASFLRCPWINRGAVLCSPLGW